MGLLIPFVLLAAGAVAMTAGMHPRFRREGLFASGAALLASVAVMALLPRLPVEATLSAWRPEALFGEGIRLRAGPVSWPFAVAMLLATSATLVTGLARPGGRRLTVRAAILLIALATLGAVMAGNFLTLAVMWSALDLIFFIALVSQLAPGESPLNRAVAGLGVNSAGTLAAIAASVLARETGTPATLGGRLTSPAVLLIALAAMLRLGLFPPRLGLPDERVSRLGLGTMLRLGPAAAALAALSHATASGLPDTARMWLALAAVGAAFFGSLELWLSVSPRKQIASFVWGASGMSLLTGMWGGEAGPAGIVAFGVCAILTGSLLFLSQTQPDDHPAWRLLPMLGVVALAGAPFTPGFVAAQALYGGLIESGAVAMVPVVMLPHVMLVAGALRLTWPVHADVHAADPARKFVEALGLAIPALMLLIAGPFWAKLSGLNALPPLPNSDGGFTIVWGVAGFLLVLALAVGLRVFEFDAQMRDLHLWERLTAFARLEWLYRAVWSAYNSIGRTMLGVTGVLEGEGAVLWTLVAALLVWILLKA